MGIEYFSLTSSSPTLRDVHLPQPFSSQNFAALQMSTFYNICCIGQAKGGGLPLYNSIHF